MLVPRQFGHVTQQLHRRPSTSWQPGAWRSRAPCSPGLEARCEVVRLNLPGFGQTPMPSGDYTLTAVADALEAHLRTEELVGADLVGSSMGAPRAGDGPPRGRPQRRRPRPGRLLEPAQKKVFGATLTASVALVRTLRPALPNLLATLAGRTALLAQLSARPWAVDRDYAVREIQGLAESPGTSPAIRALSTGADQQGAPAAPSRDRCWPSGALRTASRSPAKRARCSSASPTPLSRYGRAVATSRTATSPPVWLRPSCATPRSARSRAPRAVASGSTRMRIPDHRSPDHHVAPACAER